jgi:multidrug efflux pump subunit AcrA (membrane-fusion protein)
MFVEGQVDISNKKVSALPDEAIVRSGENQYVFIKKGASNYEMKAVVTGISKDGNTEILSGLEKIPDSSIVLNNAFKLLGILKNSAE